MMVVQFGLAIILRGVVEGRFRIDFRHHQGHVRLLPEGGGIVNDHTARSRRDRSEFQGNASACAEQGDIHPIKGFFRQFFYSQHFPTESDLFSGGPGGGQKLQGTYGKIACFQAGQDFNAHRSGGADDGNMGCLVHDCCQKMTDIFRPPPIIRQPGHMAIRLQAFRLKNEKLSEILHPGQLLKNGKDRVFYFSACGAASAGTGPKGSGMP